MKKAKRRSGTIRNRKTSKKASRKPARKASRRTASKARRPAARKAQAPSKVVMATPLRGQANLIITFDPNHRGTAEAELREILRQIGEKPQIGQTEVEGLFKAAVSNPRTAITKIRKLCSSNPSLFSVTHHYTPIDTWCSSDVPSMQKAIRAASAGIGQSEKWKLGLNKRHWDTLDGGKLIMKLTEVIDRKKVDLDNPEKIVKVEIIGKSAGIALLSPDNIFDVQREKGG